MTAAPRAAFVTGGAGFVGSTLVERLLADGWRVTAFDNFDPYYEPARKRANLSSALSSPGFRLIAGDTRDAASLRAALTDDPPEIVFDLAARAGVRPSIADPAGYVDVNVRGLQHLLSAVADVGSRLVFASSSSIYGNDDRRPFREDQARGRPESPYGATKVAGEALVHAHHAVTGLPVAVARLFTVYGPRQRPDLAIHSFARAILRGEPIRLFDQGRGVRDYTFVDDVVEAFLAMATVDHRFLLANVGSHHPIRTVEVVDELERALGRTTERILEPAQVGDVEGTHADIARARELLGWEPRVPFRDGIERFCAWLTGSGSPAAGGQAAGRGSPEPIDT
jgi:UDP-glucuronate 4-epimerase